MVAKVDDRTRASGDIPLGSWFGVRISANWTVLVTLALFVDLLALSALPTATPGHGSFSYWLAGTVTSTAFFITLIAHELAHALVARHYGVDVHRITLWMLGGLTELEGQSPSPRAEIAIATAGPATSAGLGVLSGLGAAWVGGTGLVSVALSWLAGVSVLLAVFNLLPGAPLDGGRILLGVLWWHYGDRVRAESASARSGRVLGMILIGLGFLELLAGGVAGLWFALLGWFIVSGAAGQRLAGQLERVKGLRADQAMAATPTVVPEWWTVTQLLHQLPPQAAAQPLLPLVDVAGAASGVITLRDLERVPAAQCETTRIREIAHTRGLKPAVVTGDTPVVEVVAQLRLHNGIAIVVDDLNRPIGLLTDADIARTAQLTELGWKPTVTH